MSAIAAATRAAKNAENDSCGVENCIEIVLVALADGITAPTRPKRRFAARCADLP
jgi:hypothetical protein